MHWIVAANATVPTAPYLRALTPRKASLHANAASPNHPV